MKRLSLLSLVLLVAILFAQDGRAQDRTRFSLPEGALARPTPSTAIPGSPTAWPHPA